MATEAILTTGGDDFAHKMPLHLEPGNGADPILKFLNGEYLNNTSNENGAVLKLLGSAWQEMERLIERAVKKEKNPKSESIFIKANDQIINLRLHDVLWIEAYGDYVNFFTDKTRYLVHSTMKGIEAKLPTDQFTRVHRSFIIRTDKIDLIDESIVQIGKKLIPIGESYRNELMSKLNLL